MLILIHGDHQSKSRQELKQHIAKAKQTGITDIVSLDGRSVALSDIIQATQSHSLFGTSSRLTIIESLFRRRSKTELKAIIDYLGSITTGSLIIWEDKQLTATQLKSLSNYLSTAFPIPKYIFKLTDALIPHQKPKLILDLLNQACDADSAEFVLIMLARQLRLHIQAKNRGPRFDEVTAIQLHHQLAAIDEKNKTGRLALDLKSELANWIINVYSN